MDSLDPETSTSKKIFTCTISGCTASFSKNRKLLSHIRVHTGERPFACNEVGCTKTYTNSSHLIRHKKVSHGEKNTPTITCEFEGCGIVFASKYSLKRHYKNKHNPELYPFKCNECSQGFRRKKQLQKHSYLHTSEVFSCDKCDISFTTSSSLNKHKRSHRVYNCDCGEIFNRWSLLLTHKKSCNQKRFTCKSCDKIFSHLRNLKYHELGHQEKSIFICPYPECQRFYFHKRNLTYHIERFHKRVNENQTFKCTYPKCSAVLKTKQYFKIHLQKHFKWTVKKTRQERKDKGKPKKTIMSVLLSENQHQIENEQIGDDKNIVGNVINEPFCNSMQTTDDNLQKECDLTLQSLKENLVTAM